MFKQLTTLIFTVVITAYPVLADEIFNYPAKAKDVAENLPPLNSISCQFTQEKTLKNKTLQSGGNFEFIKDKGVFFETLYPVKAVSSYTADQNKQISNVIQGIANKDYSFINKNFNLFYLSEDDVWTIALTPKEKSPAYGQLESIIIYGKTDINRININTTNGMKTNISFTCGI